MKIKNIIGIFTTSLALVSCSQADIQNLSEVARKNLIGMANPFTEVKTIAEAEKLVGFSLSVPKEYEKYNKQVIRVMKNEMIEVIYQDNSENEGLRIRKAKGSQDISGDYNNYETTNTINIGNLKIVEKRNGDNVGVVTWTDSKYSYSVNMKDAILKHENFDKFIMSIK